MKKVLIILISMLSCNFCLAQDILELKSEAKRGDATAMNRLGVIYHGGKGVTQDYGEAMKWYKMADKKRDDWAPSDAMRVFSACYRYGIGTAIDNEKAEYWLKKSAEQGDEKAKRILEYEKNQ